MFSAGVYSSKRKVKYWGTLLDGNETLHAMSVQPMDLGDPRVDANIDAVEREAEPCAGDERTGVMILKRALEAPTTYDSDRDTKVIATSLTQPYTSEPWEVVTDTIEVERMERLTQLVKDVVRRIDDVVDRPRADRATARNRYPCPAGARHQRAQHQA